MLSLQTNFTGKVGETLIMGSKMKPDSDKSYLSSFTDLNSNRWSCEQCLAMASIRWSTWIFREIFSLTQDTDFRPEIFLIN